MTHHRLRNAARITALAALLPSSALAIVGESAPPEADGEPPIAFGYDAYFGQFPWAARLSFSGGQYCSGVLVHPRFVLTAAHCFNGGAGLPTVRFRDVELAGDHHQIIEAVAVTIHPNYTVSNATFDIAVVELDSTAYPSVAPLNTDPTPTFHRLAGWGLSEWGIPSDHLQWANFTWSGNASGPLVMYSTEGAAACPGDSGAGYIALIDDTEVLTAIHSQSNTPDCLDASEWYAVPVNVAPIRDFITDVVGNLDRLQSYGASQRDRLYNTPPYSDTWAGHAMLWKLFNNLASHDYYPQLPVVDPPLECSADPAATLNAMEATQFESTVFGVPDDPGGTWGCHEVASRPDMYLAAAYSLYRWGSPAYVRASNDSAVAIDRLTFEVFYAGTNDSADLLEACAWDFAPSLDAQAAADLCDLDDYDIVLHLVDGMEWNGTPHEYSWCVPTFEGLVDPQLDIVFDPPEGETLMTTAQLRATMPGLVPSRAERTGPHDGARRSRTAIAPTPAAPMRAEASMRAPSVDAPPPPDLGGFYFDEDCTLP